ncbi:UNVERIFIED_CONTAM: Fimbrin-2 [Sesamum angustifolium]|uniref:Fimbrin-2 n=1 Tax=Sesamum angustifolium TaxID=2727405 RepID=A0AAW2QT43_9LAMI
MAPESVRQVESRSLKSSFMAMRRESSGGLKLAELPEKMSRLKHVGENLTEQERASFLSGIVYLKLQALATERRGSGAKNASAFLKSPTSTLLHTISESEKASYVAHINNYLAEDEFLKKYLPIDPATNDLFEIAKDGVLICKLINVAVPGTIDERAINTKRVLNPWERNENHTLCLNSAKAIGCTVVNIGTQDFIEGRRHLVLGVISQIIKVRICTSYFIQNIATIILRTCRPTRTITHSAYHVIYRDVEELLMTYHQRRFYLGDEFSVEKGRILERTVTNFSSDVKDAEAYAHLLNVLAPEHANPSTLTKDPLEEQVFLSMLIKWVAKDT